jgi:plastocyanin
MNRPAFTVVTVDMRIRALGVVALPAATVIVLASGCGSSSSGTSSSGTGSSGYGSSSVAATSAPAVAAATSAGASVGSSSTAGSSSSGTTLQIKDFMFGATTVAAGSKVEVENEDSAPHTVNVNGTNIDVTVSPGGKATFTAPSKPGSYALTCDIHPSMHGSLVVS